MNTDKLILHGPELCKPLSNESLGTQLYNSLARYSNRDALIHGITNERLTYRRLLEVSCRLAESLKNAGYKQNDVISVCSENNLQFFYPVVAALYLGIIVAPFNHDYQHGELLHVAGISKPRIIFCSKAVVRKMLDLKNNANYIERIVVLDTQEPLQGVETLDQFLDKNSDKYFDEYSFRPVRLNIESHLAVILCSSGTTGLPKGVTSTHQNVNMTINHLDDDRLHKTNTHAIKLGLMPFFHGFGFMTGIGSLVCGHTVVLLPRFEEKSFLNTIETYKISNLWIVPPLIIFLAKSPLVAKYNLSSITEIVSGAAPLNRETEALVKKRLNISCIRQAYGLTESTLAVILMPRNCAKPGSSGTVVPGMSCIVRDPETGKSLGPGQIGEVCVKGKMVMKGYHENPEANKLTFTDDGWLLTGDLAYYDADGFFYIVDRLKELIKCKGFQVAPAELEALLITHPKILDAGVVGLPDERAGELPAAYVVKQPGVDLTEQEVKDFVAKHVSHAKRLQGGVRFLAAIPKNPSGKILRRELRKMVISSKL